MIGSNERTTHYSSQEQYYCSTEQYARLHEVVENDGDAQAIPRIALVKALRETRTGVVGAGRTGGTGVHCVVGCGDDVAWQAVVRTSNMAYRAWYSKHIHPVLVRKEEFVKGSVIDRAAMLSYTPPSF